LLQNSINKLSATLALFTGIKTEHSLLHAKTSFLNLKDDILNDNEIRLLNQMYSTLYQHEFTVCASVKVCEELYDPSVIGVYWEDNSRILGVNCADITPKVPLSLVVLHNSSNTD
jgi:hypothetical protein